MSNLSKVNNFLDTLEFENDFGHEPILVGRFTDDKAFIGVCSIALAFVSWTITPPLAAIVALIAVNDLKSVDGVKPDRKKVPPVVDTTAEEVYDNYDNGDYVEVENEYEEPVKPRSERPEREGRATRRESTQQPTQRLSEPVEEPVEEPVDEPPTSAWTWGERSDETEEEVIPRRPREKSEKNQRSSGAIPQLPQVTSRAKREVIQRLKEECPPLLKLVKSHPSRIVGIQRTGKSMFVQILVLLRMILLDGHQAIASTPHYEPKNAYPDVFRTVGITADGKRDYPSIRREWQALAQRVEECRIGNTTTIWDEFGLMDKVLEEEEIKSVLTSCLRETMKFGEYPIFILHGETAAFMPGSKGLVNVLLNGTVRVETIGESIEGEDGLEMIRPTGKFNITWLDGSTDSGKIPEWLTKDFLLELLGNPKAKELPRAEKVAAEDFTVSSGLKEPMKTLFAKCSEHGDWITVREIQRLNLSALKGKTSKQIHQYLGLMADSGLGEIDEENRSDSSVRFRVCRS